MAEAIHDKHARSASRTATRLRRKERVDRPPATGRTGAPPGWRSEVVRASGWIFLLGLWLIVSPWVLNYREADAVVLALVLGAAVASLALLRAIGAYRQEWLSWLTAAIGAWLVVSAPWLPDSRRAFWNFVVVGVVVFATAAWSASARSSRREHKPPW